MQPIPGASVPRHVMMNNVRMPATAQRRIAFKTAAILALTAPLAVSTRPAAFPQTSRAAFDVISIKPNSTGESRVKRGFTPLMCSPLLKSEACSGAGRIDATSKAASVWVESTVATAKARTSAAVQVTFMLVKTGMAENSYRKR